MAPRRASQPAPRPVPAASVENSPSLKHRLERQRRARAAGGAPAAARRRAAGRRVPAGDQGGARSSAGAAASRRRATGATGTAASGYSGVALLVRRSVRAESPGFSHPAFDLEQRIVVADFGATKVASVYVPNGGKDFDVKLRFLEALADWTAETARAGQALVICGDLNVAREDRDVHPKERKPNQIGTRPEERALLGRLFDGGLADVGRDLDPGNDAALHVVGAVAQPAPAEHRLAHRLRAREPGLSPRARSSVSMREFGTSDHAPVVVTFDGVLGMSLRLRLIVVFFLLSVVPLGAVTLLLVHEQRARGARRGDARIRSAGRRAEPADAARDRAAQRARRAPDGHAEHAARRQPPRVRQAAKPGPTRTQDARRRRPHRSPRRPRVSTHGTARARDAGRTKSAADAER